MSEEIVLEIKLPVAVKELAAVTESLGKIHGRNLFMRQVGDVLQIFKPDPTLTLSSPKTPTKT